MDITALEPIVDAEEYASLEEMNEDYKKMLEPGPLSRLGDKIDEKLPQTAKDVKDNAKEVLGTVKNAIAANEYYESALKVCAEGFKVVEENVTKFTISKKEIVSMVNKQEPNVEINEIQDIKYARQYNIAKATNIFKNVDLAVAFVEGGATGFFGFKGIPFNLVLSTFLYFRAVQAIAMFYGYDVKNDPSEMMIASGVFAAALSLGKEDVGKREAIDSQNTNLELENMTEIIGKLMLYGDLVEIKAAAGKSWAAVINTGTAGELIVQMRALANKAAANALKKAGKKNAFEKTVFENVFKQVGKQLTQEAVGKMVDVIGAVVGALFDIGMMNRISNYADIFYGKRFIIEKEDRINNCEEEIVDIAYEDIENIDENS